MRNTIILLAIALTGCSKKTECYLCQKDGRKYKHCNEVSYSPSMTFEETIEYLESEGYECDYYVDDI